MEHPNISGVTVFFPQTSLTSLFPPATGPEPGDQRWTWPLIQLEISDRSAPDAAGSNMRMKREGCT
jgi:hypothetical protein